ncbi:MAG: two-component system response regulator UczR [Alphaproteobacteria bacterium]
MTNSNDQTDSAAISIPPTSCPARVLLLEDDVEAAGYLIHALTQAGHQVEHTDTAEAAQDLTKDQQFDLLVLDRMLPGMDGLTFLKGLRDGGNDTPALILSALGDVSHRVEGLRTGGDDYLAKPFATEELLARVESLARRRAPVTTETETTLTVGPLTLDRMRRMALREGQEIDLKQREYQLLETLMKHAGQVVTRKMLLEEVWNYNFDPGTNVIDVHISRLRRKVDHGFVVNMIRTIRGKGYMLQGNDD